MDDDLLVIHILMSEGAVTANIKTVELSSYLQVRYLWNSRHRQQYSREIIIHIYYKYGGCRILIDHEFCGVVVLHPAPLTLSLVTTAINAERNSSGMGVCRAHTDERPQSF